jgi:hypothetical protein
MTQTENQIPEVVRISVETQNRSLKERMGRRLATFALGAGATAYVVAGFPNPFSAVGDFVDDVRDLAADVWDGAADILGKGKDAADEAVADVTRREAQPLIVDPKDVIKGAVMGRTAFGLAEREYHIRHASKKWNTWMPEGDEWVNIENATYVGEAYVPGDIQVTGTNRNITVTLPAPMRDMDVSLRTQPEINDDPQLFPQIGQVPGAETNPAQALRELHAYAERLEANDTNLMYAASCWGVESARGLLVPTLELAGFEVLQGTTQGVDGNLENDLQLTVRGRLQDNEALQPGQDGYRSRYVNSENCADMLQNQIPALQDETFVLPRHSLNEVSLEQEDI